MYGELHLPTPNFSLGLYTQFQVNQSGLLSISAAASRDNMSVIDITLSALAQSNANTTTINGFTISSAGAIVQDTVAGTINWNGMNIQMPNITQTTGTVASIGLKITGGTVTSGTQKYISISNGSSEVMAVRKTALYGQEQTNIVLTSSNSWGQITGGGRLDIFGNNGLTGSSVSGDIFLHASTGLYLDGPTTITRSGDATSTATQKDSYANPLQSSLWTGAASALYYAGQKHIASTGTNLASRLAFIINTTSSTLASGIEAFSILSTGSIGMGIIAPAASSILDITSTTKGFLPPRMTTAQRDSIASPATGLMIYNTTTNKINFFSSAWIDTITGGVYSLTANQESIGAITVLVGATWTMPANFATVGMVIRVKILYRFVKTISPPTLTCNLNVGGSSVAQIIITSVSSATTSGGMIEGTITILTTGAGGTLISGISGSNDHGITTATNWNPNLINIATSAIDTTATKVISIDVKQTTAVASNVLTISQGYVEVVKI